MVCGEHVTAFSENKRQHILQLDRNTGCTDVYTVSPYPDWIEFAAGSLITSLVRLKVEQSYDKTVVVQLVVVQDDCADRHHVVADLTASSHVLALTTTRQAAFAPDTCSRLHVSRTSSNCIRIQVDTCRRDDNFVADTGYNVDDDRRYKWIQLVSGLHIRLKRGTQHNF